MEVSILPEESMPRNRLPVDTNFKKYHLCSRIPYCTVHRALLLALPNRFPKSIPGLFKRLQLLALGTIDSYSTNRG
jgi:hypothetical protein